MAMYRRWVGVALSTLTLLLITAAATASTAAQGAGSGWSQQVNVTERVVSTSTRAGGYPGREPSPGRCVDGPYDANFSESTLALRPGTEQLTGGSKAYFGRWSTFRAYHTASFSLSSARPGTHIVNGFDCITAGTQSMPPSWSNVTDPTMVYDTRGRVHQAVLAFNAYWGSIERPNGNVYAVYSDDGGRHWLKGNSGRPVERGPSPSTASSRYLDKPWVAANQQPTSPWRDHVYAAWVQFDGDSASVHTAVTRDRGATWSRPLRVPAPVALGSANPWPVIAVDAAGVVHLSFVSYGAGSAATVWTTRSANDGRSWSRPSAAVRTSVQRECCLPGTKIHDGVVEMLTASRDRPGHLYLVWEELRGGRMSVRLATSRDSGRTWSAPTLVNDDASPTDQFQPAVATGPGGLVAVAFYDKRAACPHTAGIARANRGRANTCIAVSLQAYRETAAGLRRLGGNARISDRLWDPNQPVQRRGGLGQRACEDVADPCPEIFIGDYFMLQVSASTVYVLSTSTAYPSAVRADGGGPIFYQRQVLARVPRSSLPVG